MKTISIALAVILFGVLFPIIGCNGKSGEPSDVPIALADADPLVQVVGQPVRFFNDGSYVPNGEEIVKYEWDFNNNGAYDATGAQVFHTFATEGKFEIQFRVTDDKGATDKLNAPLIITTKFSVEKLPPVAVASVTPTEQTVNLPLHFFDNGSYDPDGGAITKFEWDWNNDGVFDAEGATADHSFSDTGVHVIQFRVTDDDGVSSVLENPLEVLIKPEGILPSPPVALATADPLQQLVDQPVHFSDNGSYDPDGGSIDKYEWDFDNDGLFDAVGASIDHSYSTPGVYEVQLRVTDDEGQMAILEQPLEVTIFSPGWALTWGGTDADNGLAVAVDDAGHIYTTGYFAGAADFDPGAGEASRLSNGLNDCWLSRLDWTGTLQWIDTWGGVGDDRAYSVATDHNNHVWITGRFQQSVDFDPGATHQIHTAVGDPDAFLSLLDTNSTFVTAQSWGGNLSFTSGRSVAVDTSGNAYVAGEFNNTVDFDPGAGIDNQLSLAHPTALANFLSEFDQQAEYKTARTWGSHYADDSGYLGPSVAAELSGGIDVAGWYDGVVDFDPGVPVDLKGYTDNTYAFFLSRYDAVVNYRSTLDWGAGLNNKVIASSITIGSSGDIYIAGAFNGTVDFDPGPAVFELTDNGNLDAFLTKFDSSGNFQWAVKWGSLDDDVASGVAVDSSGNVYVTGHFSDVVDFDPGIASDDHTSNGLFDAFVSKFDSSGNFIWARTWGGSGWDRGTGIAVDGSGNACAIGTFMGTVDMDPGFAVDNRTSNGGLDVFLMKLQPNGDR